MPILLATSPLAATRSAPTTTASARCWLIRNGAAPSQASRCSMPSWPSSQQVSRAPWSSGLVSSTITCASAPSACRARITPSAVPQPRQARLPVLQWVWMRSRPDPQVCLSQSAPRRLICSLAVTDEPITARAAASTAARPCGILPATAVTSRRRLTAVGLASAIRLISASSRAASQPSRPPWRTASATPRAPAAPSTGAPRTASVVMASTSWSTVVMRSVRT